MLDDRPQPGAAPGFLATAVRGLLLGVMAVSALLLLLGTLLLGAVVGTGVVVWSLLRGRRPSGLYMRRWTQRAGPVPAQGTQPWRRRRPAVTGEVIDAEVRELTPSASTDVPPER